MTDRPEHAMNAHAIVRISVEKLFGRFDYELPETSSKEDLSNLFILYGDNGSGKTTILRLLFALLSTEDNKGHKTSVSQVRFRRFAVELADGTRIEALRNGKSIDGPYTATILKNGKPLVSVDLPFASPNPQTDEQDRLRKFLRHLADLDLTLHFLPDDRRMLGGSIDNPRLQFQKMVQRHAFHPQVQFVTQTEDSERLSPGHELRSAVERAVVWINQQALRGSNLGQQNVHSIYVEVAKHIAASPIGVPTDIRTKSAELAQKLEELSKISDAYSHFGIASRLPVNELTGTLTTAPSETLTVIYHVLQPYVQGIEARLKALHSTHRILAGFIKNLNMFFGKEKRISFDLRHGFSIMSGKQKLELEMLSSGERQLLLLLCNTLAARDRASIFIIDEPEISLNVKWQRRLVQALLDCIRGGNVQMIFATHSIELLAQHRKHLVRLVHQDKGRARGSDAENGAGGSRAPNDRRVGSQV
jgi:energy-coupling factor transporter ATP-binding protein EcfA2